jgi:phospholipid/cholesterol/gamma-HCH transport system substrate-binding protein
MNAQRQFALGVFFVVALSILAFYTLFLTDFSLFKEPIKMTADFPDANALRTGDPVLVAGKRIGRVKTILYRPAAESRRRIRVLMHLDEPIELGVGYVIAIEDSTFLGGHDIDIDPGPFGAPPAQPDGEGIYLGIVRKSPLAALEIVGNLVSENAGSVTSILKSLESATAALNSGPGIANRLLYDEQLAADATAAVGDLRVASRDLRDTIADAREIAALIRAGEGTLGKLLADDTLYRQALETVESLHTVALDLEAGKGVVGTLLHDDAVALQVRTIVDDIAGVTRGLANGEGLLGKALKDPALAEQLKTLVESFAGAGADVREIAAKLRSGEGTLGKLLNDPELYDEALTALKVLVRSLEDYRESAPVSAFTSAVLGAL